MNSMKHRVLSQTTREPLDALELHVLAKAYYAAWWRVHGSEPIGKHAIPSLEVVIDFRDSPENGTHE
jgi:hypothetical protein